MLCILLFVVAAFVLLLIRTYNFGSKHHLKSQPQDLYTTLNTFEELLFVNKRFVQGEISAPHYVQQAQKVREVQQRKPEQQRDLLRLHEMGFLAISQAEGSTISNN